MSEVTIGVGDGSGQLFVHGDYDSVKAVQTIILERDQLRAESAKLKAVADAARKYGATRKGLMAPEIRSELGNKLDDALADYDAWVKEGK